ncbi:putative porin [Flavobacterium sp.]|uniref:putative porin n=1 Tax=Flavobacterium sp. TaxID=239 RepID=UPI0038FCD156
MKHIFTFLLFIFTIGTFAQVDKELSINKNDTIKRSLRDKPKENPKAPINMYRIITLQRDTTYVDTSLTIHKDYKFNHLRKDNFGLLPFANDGQTYNTLDFGLNNPSTFPEFGFKAKHFNYSKAKDINYYSVATPITELYFKTVLEQGQSVDAFITLNTSEQLNLSVAYKGLRSLGKYVNSLSSSGNFRFTTSYFSKNKRYLANFHYVSQDVLNGENGGVSGLSNFESGNSQFIQRSRLEVYFEDASTLLKGKRYFLDHSFRINSKDSENNISINHQFSYETKMFEFSGKSAIDRFGNGYVASNYFNVTKSNITYNKLGASFSNKILGDFHFFVENYQYNYLYKRIIISNNQVLVPNLKNDKLNAVGGKYIYSKNKLKGEALFSKSISKQTFSTLDISAQYKWNEKNNFYAQYLNQSKVPDLNYTLYQSEFISYNWYNNFKNEKINTIKLKANTQWLNAEVQITSLDDYLYFSDDDASDTIIISTPKQYNKTINYFSIKVSKELKFRKFALDNTVLFQQVSQDNNILNVPKFVARNTLYFSDYVFKKAMYLQTGFTFQTFTKYYANDYNPLIGEFYVQEKTKIGDFPLVDFFINARVRQARIFLKAEHLNSSFTGRNYYSAPNYPYKDFIIRFGLVWTFFQ